MVSGDLFFYRGIIDSRDIAFTIGVVRGHYCGILRRYVRVKMDEFTDSGSYCVFDQWFSDSNLPVFNSLVVRNAFVQLRCRFTEAMIHSDNVDLCELEMLNNTFHGHRDILKATPVGWCRDVGVGCGWMFFTAHEPEQLKELRAGSFETLVEKKMN